MYTGILLFIGVIVINIIYYAAKYSEKQNKDDTNKNNKKEGK